MRLVPRPIPSLLPHQKRSRKHLPESHQPCHRDTCAHTVPSRCLSVCFLHPDVLGASSHGSLQDAGSPAWFSGRFWGDPTCQTPSHGSTAGRVGQASHHCPSQGEALLPLAWDTPWDCSQPVLHPSLAMHHSLPLLLASWPAWGAPDTLGDEQPAP